MSECGGATSPRHNLRLLALLAFCLWTCSKRRRRAGLSGRSSRPPPAERPPPQRSTSSPRLKRARKCPTLVKSAASRGSVRPADRHRCATSSRLRPGLIAHRPTSSTTTSTWRCQGRHQHRDAHAVLPWILQHAPTQEHTCRERLHKKESAFERLCCQGACSDLAALRPRCVRDVEGVAVCVALGRKRHLEDK